MKHFQFSTVFSTRRKELGVTQEQIAEYVGVSRAAVSKWEKGLSYPDITLLPKLATYFNVSIDTLLGYEPQLTKERITVMYRELAHQFSNRSFEKVQEEMEQLLTEYYSCFPFVLKMAQLYLNYYTQATQPNDILTRVQELCGRVKEFSEDYQLVNEAVMIEASAMLIQGQAQEVLQILGKDVPIQFGTEQLIAMAHNMLGDTAKAKETLQVSMYQHVMHIISCATENLMLEVEHVENFDETVCRIESFIQIFHVKHLNVNSPLVFYLKAAAGYVMQNRLERALEMIEAYCHVCYQLKFPIQLQGDDYFYLLSDWMEEHIQLGGQAPRDDLSIKKDLVNSLTHQPVFAPLYNDPKYKAIIANLKHHLKVEEENEC
ncbi:helix-turn-helix domain-containing protein [Lysinibacillus sp. LZ02]|uniref:helix-turn-helix domain-containing protein n=1 Tax=Lysinibacillus sp. LZ02 TaxID=3420668 RepID=UPI003D369E05